jgi:hypothetical protein
MCDISGFPTNYSGDLLNQLLKLAKLHLNFTTSSHIAKNLPENKLNHHSWSDD